WRIEHDIDAVLLQKLRRSDAGELQQLRRIIRAAGNEDFLARLRGAQAPFLFVFDRPGAPPFEQDALRQRRSFDLQIAALHRGAKIGERGAGAAAAPGRGLEEARALLALAIEI